MFLVNKTLLVLKAVAAMTLSAIFIFMFLLKNPAILAIRESIGIIFKVFKISFILIMSSSRNSSKLKSSASETVETYMAEFFSTILFTPFTTAKS